MVTTKMTFDVSRRTVPQTLVLKQGDRMTRTLSGTIVGGGEIIDATSLSAAIYVRRPDGEVLYNTIPGGVANGQFDYTFTASELAVTGTGYAEIRLLNSDETKVLSTLPFALRIERGVYSEDALLATNSGTKMQEYVDAAKDAADRAESAADDVTDAKNLLDTLQQEAIKTMRLHRFGSNTGVVYYTYPYDDLDAGYVVAKSLSDKMLTTTGLDMDAQAVLQDFADTSVALALVDATGAAIKYGDLPFFTDAHARYMIKCDTTKKQAVVLDDIKGTTSSGDIADGSVTPSKTNFATEGNTVGVLIGTMDIDDTLYGRVSVTPGKQYLICPDGGSDTPPSSVMVEIINNAPTVIERTPIVELPTISTVDATVSSGRLVTAPDGAYKMYLTTLASDTGIKYRVYPVSDSVLIDRLYVDSDNIADKAVGMDKLSDDVKDAMGGTVDLSDYYTKAETAAAIRDAMYTVVDATANSDGTYSANGIKLSVSGDHAVVGDGSGDTANALWITQELIIPAYIRIPSGEVYAVTEIGASSLTCNALTMSSEYKEARVYIPRTVKTYGASCFAQYYGDANGHLYIVTDSPVAPSGYDSATTTVYRLDNPLGVVDLATKAEVAAVDTKVGDIDTALDSIIAVQNSLIGGATE